LRYEKELASFGKKCGFLAFSGNLSPFVPLSPASGGIFNMKWRGVHPEGEIGGEVKVAFFDFRH
jgi:hypothetical protein